MANQMIPRSGEDMLISEFLLLIKPHVPAGFFSRVRLSMVDFFASDFIDREIHPFAEFPVVTEDTDVKFLEQLARTLTWSPVLNPDYIPMDVLYFAERDDIARFIYGKQKPSQGAIVLADTVVTLIDHAFRLAHQRSKWYQGYQWVA